MNFEDELRRQLHQQGNTESLDGLKGLGEVTDAAHGRAKRQRMGGGLFAGAALAVISVLGIQAMSGDSTRNVSTAISIESTPEAAATTDEVATDDASETQSDDAAPASAETITVEGSPPPDVTLADPAVDEISQVTFDGNEFAGFSGPMVFRSSDGVSWESVETVGLPDGVISAAAAHNGRTIVLVSEFEGIDAPSDPLLGGPLLPNESLSIAFSDDLINWTANPIPTVEPIPGITVSQWADSIVLNNTGALFQVHNAITPNPAELGLDPDTICGYDTNGPTMTVLNCDGSSQELSIGDAAEPTRVYFTVDGTSFDPVDISGRGTETLIATDQGFLTLDPLEGLLRSSTDGRTFTSASLDDTFSDSIGFGSTATTRGSEVVFTTSPTDVAGDALIHYSSDGGANWTSTLINPLLPPIDDEPSQIVFGPVATGPGGFATTVDVFAAFGLTEAGPLIVARDGYSLTLDLPSQTYRLASDDGSVEHFYGGDVRGPEIENVQQGVFGGLRFLDPDSGDVLFDVPNSEHQELLDEAFGALRDDAPFLLLIDGYTIAGSLLGDTITLTGPDGQSREINQLDSDNDDVTDGIEKLNDGNDPFGPSELVFYDTDGSEILRISTNLVFQTADLQAAGQGPGNPEDSAPFSISDGTLTLEGTFPEGEIVLLDADGTILNTWFAGPDFDPATEADIVWNDTTGDIGFIDPASGAVLSTNVLSLIEALPEGNEIRESVGATADITEPTGISRVLFSTDGVNWEVIHESDQVLRTEVIAVGPDGVALVDYGFGAPRRTLIPTR